MPLSELDRETEVARRTQTKILEAAKEVIAEVGYARLRMEAVARGSGITRQTIYNYFPGKAQLVAAVLLQEGSAVNEQARGRLPETLEGEALLSAAIIALVDAARASPLFGSNFAEGSISYINDLAEHSSVVGSVMHDYWGPVIARLAAGGRLRGDISEARLEWWLSHLYRSMLWRPADELDNRREMDALIRDFIVPSVLVA